MTETLHNAHVVDFLRNDHAAALGTFKAVGKWLTDAGKAMADEVFRGRSCSQKT